VWQVNYIFVAYTVEPSKPLKLWFEALKGGRITMDRAKGHHPKDVVPGGSG